MADANVRRNHSEKHEGQDTNRMHYGEVAQNAEEQHMPSPKEQEAAIKKKYGGIIPRRLPLISKDHERAFFDSADWALEKQGAPVDENPEIPTEALRPKLQPTPHQPLPSRRSAYASEDETGASGKEEG